MIRSGWSRNRKARRRRRVSRGKHRRDRVLRRRAALDLARDEVADDLGVGLALELAALGDQLVAQRLEVLDDAVVDQRDAADDVRVGVADGRRAMRRPARVGDAGAAGQRLRRELAREIVELALGAPADRARRRSIVQMPAES